RTPAVYKNLRQNLLFSKLADALSRSIVDITVGTKSLSPFLGSRADWGTRRKPRSKSVLNPLNVACMQMAASRLPVLSYTYPMTKERRKRAIGAGHWGPCIAAKMAEVTAIPARPEAPAAA